MSTSKTKQTIDFVERCIRSGEFKRAIELCNKRATPLMRRIRQDQAELQRWQDLRMRAEREQHDATNKNR